MHPDEMIKKLNVLRKEKNAIILAHNYQSIEIQKIADIVGDSFQLAKACLSCSADIILFCGVKFMAETAKLLNPNTKVLLSHGEAGCPMADMVDVNELQLYREKNPHDVVICYVNSTAEVKAMSDICVTSSNAVDIVSQLPKEKRILFIPDKNLGHYVRLKTGRHIVLWDGACPIHDEVFTVHDVNTVKLMYHDHHIIVHPECPPDIVAMADFVGSTFALSEYVKSHDRVVIGTEIGLINMLIDRYPKKSIQSLNENAICHDMKKTALIDVLETLEYELNETIIPEKIFQNALKPIRAMIDATQ
jgi:quinolinate synthase